MKIHILLLLSLLSHHALLSQSDKSTSKRLDLMDAVRQKMVSVQLVGMGGHSGESVKMTCKSLTGKIVSVRIPMGLLVHPADTGQQTLVVSGEHLFAANAKTPVEINLRTFCTEAGDASPSTDAVFKVGAMAPQMVCDLLKYVSETGIKDESSVQSAVWSLTSKKPLGYIQNKDLLHFTAKLLGTNAPGYTIKSKAVEEVPGRTADLGKAMVVEGNFQYYLDKDTKVLMNLVDSTGKVVKQVSKEEVMKAGEHRSGITLQVWNLDPGKYILRMQTKSGKVIKDMPVEF
jgi:hypothetical protein